MVNSLRTSLKMGLYALLFWLYLVAYVLLIQLVTGNWMHKIGQLFVLVLGAFVMFAIGLAIGRYTPRDESRPIPFRAWAPLMFAMIFIGSTQLVPDVDRVGFLPILLYWVWLLPLFALIYRCTRASRSADF